MTDQVLNILKFVLLGLLYLFFARVLWAVWSEVRTPVGRGPGIRTGGRKNDDTRVVVPVGAATTPLARPAQGTPSKADTKRSKKAAKGKQGRAGRLVVLEPAARRGTTVALAGEITIGREPGCTIVIDDDAFISQVHVRIFDYDGQPMVEDLGSTNGTYHNGVKLIGAKLLHQGDRLQLGTTLIEAQ